MLKRFDSKRNGWTGGAAMILAMTIATVAGLGVQPPVAAQSDGTGRPCSNQTLHADYGLLVAGQRAVPPFLGGGIEKFVGSAMLTFDGEGSFLIQGTGAGLHGEVTGIDPGNDGILGTYEVNSNCTGTMQFQPPAPIPPIVFSFVIVDRGRRVNAAVMSPRPNVTTAELVRK